MQCSSANTASSGGKQECNDEDEDVQTLLGMMASTEFHVRNAITSKAHTEYLVLVACALIALAITDSGADSHIGGKHWLALTPTKGPGVRFANVVGFVQLPQRNLDCPLSLVSPWPKQGKGSGSCFGHGTS